MTKLLSVFITFMLLISTFIIPLPTKANNTNDTFQNQLTAFPQSYHKALEELHEVYPNWEFVVDSVPTTFTEAVNSQDFLFNKSVESQYHSWHSMRNGCYNWGSKKFNSSNHGNSYGASREVIAYFMDPRNFLNVNDIYMFLQLSFNEDSQTIADLEKLIKGTFLDAVITEKNDRFHGERFAVSLISAAKESNLNVFELANTILRIQGADGSVFTQGVKYENETIYNYFNVGAFGSTQSELLTNGKYYAYSQKWFSPSESILAGAMNLCCGFINNGQDTHFYKNFNVLQPGNISHQYSRNVSVAFDSAKALKENYLDQCDLKLVFRIPVYKSMPSRVAELPTKTNLLNNYYLNDIVVTGLSPEFNRYNSYYTLTINGDKTIYISLPKGATYCGSTTFSVKKGSENICFNIKSATGYKNQYIVNVNAKTDCLITVSTDTPPLNDAMVLKGDANGDGRVNIADLLLVRFYLHKFVPLNKLKFKESDTNNDGKISLVDMSNIYKHISGELILK